MGAFCDFKGREICEDLEVRLEAKFLDLLVPHEYETSWADYENVGILSIKKILGNDAESL